MLNIFTWIASALTLSAMFLISGRNNNGFLLALIGSVVWVAIGFYSGLTGLIALNAILVGTDAYGYIKGLRLKNRGLEFVKDRIKCSIFKQ
jgi:CDP-diglyceride synthetase